MKLLMASHSSKFGVETEVHYTFFLWCVISPLTENQKQKAALIHWSVLYCLGRGRKRQMIGNEV